MKAFLILITVLFLSACGGDTSEKKYYYDNTENYELPEGLADCKIYGLQSKHDYMHYITVLRCGDAVTTKTSGKFSKTVNLIEE